MTPKLPPAPQGQISGFPYSILWEEFGQIWEELGGSSKSDEIYEALLVEAKLAGVDLSREPGRQKIGESIQPLELPSGAAGELEAKLYRIAAAYRTPYLKKALGRGAAATRTRLQKIANASANFADLLDGIPLEEEVVLGLLRHHTDPDTELPIFHLKHLISEIRKLADTARMVADECPQMPRGTSVDILKPRLMEAASRAIGIAALGDELIVLQADSAGRNPRPKSRSAQVLFGYLQLVDPSLTQTAMVRLFARHNYGPKHFTREELDACDKSGSMPKRWPLHDAREKLIR